MTSLNGHRGENRSILLRNFNHILDDTLFNHHNQSIQHHQFPHHQLSIDLYHISDEIIQILTKLTSHGDRSLPIICHIRIHRLKRPYSPAQDDPRLPRIAHHFFTHRWLDRMKRAFSEDGCLPHRQNPWTSWLKSEFWVLVSANRV